MAEYFQKWERTGNAEYLQNLLDRVKSYREANEYESALLIDDGGNTIARDIEPPRSKSSPELLDAVNRVVHGVGHRPRGQLGLQQAEHLLLDARIGLAGQPHEVEGPWSEATGGGGHGTPRYCQGAPRRTPRILH